MIEKKFTVNIETIFGKKQVIENVDSKKMKKRKRIKKITKK